MEKSFGFKLVLIKKEGGTLPLIQQGFGSRKRFVSVPLADYAGPTYKTDECFAALLAEAKNLGQVTIFTDQEPPTSPDGWHLDTPFESYRMETKMSYEDLKMKVIHQKTRNMLNKAERLGVKAEKVSLEVGIDKYYPIYMKTMLRLQALPLPKKFFKNLDGLAHVFEARLEGKVLAGVVGIEYEDTLYVWSNASTKKGSKTGANNLAYAAAIRYAAENPELKWVDFGSTVPGTSHAFFKARWGGEPYPIYRLSTEKAGPESQAQKKIVNVLKYAPRPLLRLMARLIYRYY
ncbi:GNAT family N-acetyltransferase [bacterium]|nr:GNAT family N-acetyltransferase [bacterium]